MKSFKQFMKGGKWVKLQPGDSETFTLNCDVMSLQSKESRYGDVIEVQLLDSEGNEKIFNVKSAATANQFAQFEEGDKIVIKKVESDDGKGRWKITSPKKSKKVEDDEDDEDEEEDEDVKPKKKVKKVVEDDEEDGDEDEAPKKKSKKAVTEDEDDEDEEIDFDDDDEDEKEEEKPAKKKKKAKK